MCVARRSAPTIVANGCARTIARARLQVLELEGLHDAHGARVPARGVRPPHPTRWNLPPAWGEALSSRRAA